MARTFFISACVWPLARQSACSGPMSVCLPRTSATHWGEVVLGSGSAPIVLQRGCGQEQEETEHEGDEQ